MLKVRQVVLAVLMSSVVLVAPARAGADPDKSPEDVFKSFAAAVKKDDMKAMMSRLTSDSQSAIAGSMWFLAIWSKPWIFTSPGWHSNIQLTSKEKERIDAIDEVLKHHDLSADGLNKALENLEKKAAKDVGEWGIFVALGEFVKDKPAFITDVNKVLADGKETADGPKEIAEVKVKEVKIEGQRAKMQTTFPGVDGKENTGTIYFKLESGVWKIDFIETYQQWPKPPPPPEVKQTAVQGQPAVIICDSRPGFLQRMFPCLRNR